MARYDKRLRSKQAQALKSLIHKGKEKGYVTHAEITDCLPHDTYNQEEQFLRHCPHDGRCRYYCL